jgi:hypothetical protein
MHMHADRLCLRLRRHFDEQSVTPGIGLEDTGRIQTCRACSRRSVQSCTIGRFAS